ncbi:MAG: baseplate J/gp47 family protein [Oxalobacter formigenes]|nr:baseplate J/gp47 family protein [Oxalobacter formigenes]
MSYTPPTLPELISQAESDIEGRLPGASARLRRSNLAVFARIMAACAKGLYGFIAWCFRQLFPDTADADSLMRQATLWLDTPYLYATYAVGTVIATGEAGSIIEAGVVLVRADGAQFTVDEGGILADAPLVLAVTAMTAGTNGNTPAETELTLMSPIDGVESVMPVGANGLTGGTDDETLEHLRQRIIERHRWTAMGGAWYDYRRWALNVPGVTRVWVYPRELGPGTVTVRIMRDDDADPYPSGAALAAVQSSLEDNCNVTADVIAVAPIPLPVNYTLAISPDTPDVREAVTEALKDFHAREATPGGQYIDPATRLPKQGGRLLKSRINEAISLAIGEYDHALISPDRNIISGKGFMPVFGKIDFVAFPAEEESAS